MRCFLSCFGFSKNRRRYELAPISLSAPPLKLGSSKQANLEDSITVFPPSPTKQEEQPSINVPKKVTLDVPTSSPISVYETPETAPQIKKSGGEVVVNGHPVPDQSNLLKNSESAGSYFDVPKKVTFDVPSSSPISVYETPETIPQIKDSGDEVVVNGDPVPDQSNLLSNSESGGSNLVSLGSYPPYHRYHNCRESDNEDEIETLEEIDVDDHGEHNVAGDVLDEHELEEDSTYMSQEVTPTPGSASSMESRTKGSNQCTAMRNLDHMVEMVNQQSEYSQSVLSPVENLTEWKAAKPRDTQQLKQKEISKQLQFKKDEAKDEHKQAVDASLSSWLVLSQRTPASKASARDLELIQSETSASSHGSNSVRTDNDRPILGALTLEELQWVSATPSPNHTTADQPIIGTVGSHWSEETPAINSGPASSFKGIPNTTSKYREDNWVKWHSTPFEARLEKALRKGSPGAPL